MSAFQFARKYSLSFELQGLPMMSNALLRGHWRKKHAHALKWKRAVWAKCWHLRPDEPLVRAMLTLTRFSSREPDTDGLVSGFKHVVDGLVEAKVIADDRPSNIGIPNYRWEKVGNKSGKIKIEVEAV